ncbi:TetR/AcrR family transcriptional regulator [Oceanobacillus sp. CAU 1775]
MKDKLTQHSILLFERKGFSQTSIQDIVDELEVTKGTFYYYFSSKEQLLMNIHLDYITDLLTRQKAILDDEYTTQRQKLTKIIHMLISDITDKGPSGRVFFREMRHLGEKHITEIREKRQQFRLNIEKIVSDGIEGGEFREDLRPDITAFGILGITNYSYNWYRPGGEVSTENLVEMFSTMLLKGIEKNKQI